MRWLVEVSGLGKSSDAQKYCVESDSWQRALQSARSQRGDDGPMSGFSIELLEEGYRAVDPVARVRFVVKRAPDDMPVTTPAAKDAKSAVPPAPAATEKTIPPTPSSTGSNGTAKSVPPRPNDEKKKPTAATIALGSSTAPAEKAAEKPIDPNRAAPPAVGSAIPGLPPLKVLTKREQDPTEASPLTYREYAFAVPEGTSDEVAADVLRAQLRLVEAHVAASKMGKLVNLAVFDVEFKGKPPRPPIATLTWKDWKGEPIIAHPKRGNNPSAVPRPPSNVPVMPPSSMPPPQAMAIPAAPAVPSFPASQAPQQSTAPGLPHVGNVQQSTGPVAPPSSIVAPAPVQTEASGLAGSRTPSVRPPSDAPAPPTSMSTTSPMVGAPAASAIPAPIPAPVPAPVVEAAPIPAPTQAPAVAAVPAQPLTQTAPMPGAKHLPQATTTSHPPPAISERPAASPSQPPSGMVKTPSGRFVRGRVTGDELITSLFESMHDLHFLRDALDGGQFCLALANEVLPARALLIHFFDLSSREWIVAACRGKDTTRLLTMRCAENDEMLVAAARKRRALVFPNAESKSQIERYRHLGGARSVIIAPIMQAGRALGALEIINPLDGMPFSEDEGNAMTYIAEQYAEYLGSRGIVIDRERIQASAQAR